MEINSPFYRVSKLLTIPGLFEFVKNKKYKPVNATIHPTLKCSCSCSNCLYKTVIHQELNLDIRTLNKAIANFTDLGVKSITISGGGEPLLGDPIVFKKIICSGFKLGINTSLALQHNQNLDLLVNNLNKLAWIRLSLDAYDEISYKTRRGNLFQNVFNNLNRLLLEKKTKCSEVTIGIAILVDRDFLNNISKLKHTLLSLLKKELIEQIDYILLRPFVKHHDDDYIDYKYIHYFMKNISLWMNDFHKEKLPLIYHQDKFKYIQKFVENRMERKANYCYGSLANIILGADGKYYRCCEFVYQDIFSVDATDKKIDQLFNELESWDINTLGCPPFCKHFSINEFVESVNQYENKHLYFI